MTARVAIGGFKRIGWRLFGSATCGGVLLFMGCGCGPSEDRAAFNQLVEETKQQLTASEIRKAVLPFIEEYYEADENKPLRNIPRSEIPKEVSTLPLFRGNPSDISCGVPLSTKGAMSFMMGNGWGIEVYVLKNDPKIDSWRRKRLIDWGEGVYFYWGE